MLICPHCEEALTLDGRVYRCPRDHTFDVAREGYVNLLRRPTKLLADTKEMLSARRRFLERGFYAPLAEAISERVGERLRAQGVTSGAILDAGCGEGYYTRRLAGALATREWPPMATSDDADPRWRIYGLDLARDGVRMAARHAQTAADAKATGERQIIWLVANLNERLPFADASLSAITNMFAPRNASEYARILVPGALLLIVIPAPDHLAEARQALGLLSIEKDKEAHVITHFRDNFILEREEAFVYDLLLDAATQSELSRMTPGARTRLSLHAEILDRSMSSTPASAPTILATHASLTVLAFARRPLSNTRA